MPWTVSGAVEKRKDFVADFVSGALRQRAAICVLRRGGPVAAFGVVDQAGHRSRAHRNQRALQAAEKLSFIRLISRSVKFLVLWSCSAVGFLLRFCVQRPFLAAFGHTSALVDHRLNRNQWPHADQAAPTLHSCTSRPASALLQAYFFT